MCSYQKGLIWPFFCTMKCVDQQTAYQISALGGAS